MNLSFEEFKRVITGKVENEFPNYEIINKNILKDNDIYFNGIVVREPKSDISRIFYTEFLYEAYQHGTSMEELMEMVRNSVKVAVSFDFSKISRDFILENVRLAAMNTEKNSERLNNIPSFSNMDISFIPRCLFADSSFVVNHSLLKNFGITEEEIFEHAKKNTAKDINIRSLFADFAPECGDLPIFTVTNEFSIFGAGILGCPEALDKIGDRMLGNYAIIPASLHQLIVMPADEVMDIEDVREMIQDVNSTGLKETDYLSDNLFFYNTDRKELKIAEESDLDRDMD